MFSAFPFCKKNQGRQECPLAVTLYQSYFYYFSDFSPFFPTSCQHFHSTEQRKSPSHALSQVPPLSDIIPLLAISFLKCILNPVTSQFTKLQCLSKVFKRTLLSKVQSVTLHLLIFSNFFSSFQTTLPEPKFALISKHPVSFHVLWAFAHFCPICMFLPHLPDTCPYFTDQRNAFSAFKKLSSEDISYESSCHFFQLVTVSSKPVYISITNYLYYNSFNSIIITITIIGHLLCPRHLTLWQNQ